MKKIFLVTLFFQTHILFSQNVTINNVSTYSDNQIDANHAGVMVRLSDSLRGHKKLISINTSTNPYQPNFGPTRWQQGAWFLGDFSTRTMEDFYEQALVDVGKYGWWSPHPKIRHTSQQVRAMIHLHNRFKPSSIVEDNIDLIKDGLNYLISQQRQDGGYIYWNERPNVNTFPLDDNTVSGNETHIYETSHALATMCEGYQYLNKIGESLNETPGLYAAIEQAASNVLNSISSTGNVYNFKGFGIWALAKAFKVTNNCDYLAQAREHSQLIINAQEKNGGICDGVWQTGTLDGPPDNSSNYYHDSAIGYHLIILRGLIETLDIIPPTMYAFKHDLANAIKRGINHVINYRIVSPSQGSLSSWGPNKNCVASVSDEVHPFADDGVEPFALLAYYSKYHPELFSVSEQTSLRNLLNQVSLMSEYSTYPSSNGQGKIDALRKLNSFAYYADYINAINTEEKVFNEDAVQLRNYDATKITGRTLVGDFDNDGKQDDIAAFYDYGYNSQGQGYETRIHVWKSNSDIFEFSNSSGWWSVIGYNINDVKAVVTGDFDNDGYIDDIAGIYDYGNNETRIHVWLGDQSHFTYMGANGFWQVQGYDANNVVGRVVSGDFDNDNKLDDIAAFYDYGNNETRIHVWRGDVNSFTYMGANGFWNVSGYNANSVTGRVVSGDFDGDSKIDDIAAFYDYGYNGQTFQTRIHVWKGENGNTLTYLGSSYKVLDGYNANNITDRVVSGNFDNDVYQDDIAAVYDYGNYETRIHTFLGQGSSFLYPSPSGYWNSTGYDANSVTGRVVAGDFINGNKVSDIGAFYNYGGGDTRLHIWNYVGISPLHFEYMGPGGWWIDCAPSQYLSARIRSAAGEPIVQISNEEPLNSDDGNFKFYPNPFSNSVTLVYKITQSGNVRISLHDIMGKKVAELINEIKDEGQYETSFNGMNFQNGIYYCVLEADGITRVGKIVLAK